MSRLDARLVLACALVPMLGACDSGGDPPAPDAGPPVTYYGDVRPILVEHCTMCHVDGGIAPFSLTTYDAAVEVSTNMREVTRERIMPPFLADGSGACNTWSNYRGLTDEEIATIGAWVDADTPEGDPSTPAPEPVVLPHLPSADLSLEMSEAFTTNDSFDDEYRCFVLESTLDADRFLVGYDVQPGNAERVHHVIVYNPTSDEQADAARQRDLEDGSATDGYTCFGAAGVDATPVVLWAPGAGSTMFPHGTGIQLSAHRPLILQIHYNNQVPEGTERTDRTRVDLALEDTANPAYMVLMGDFDLNLPPRTQEWVESQRMSLSALPVNVRVWGVFPHMHTLGRTIHVDLNRQSGGDQCLIDVPRWDFHWQMAYWLSTPITVTPEDAATITCTYDTRDRDTTTNFGDGTEDEMCLAFTYVTL